jgi:hypothetical protein
MTEYKYASHYMDVEHQRDGLNTLSQDIWGITVLHGGETDYTPFSYFIESDSGSSTVANVCVGQFKCVVNGLSVNASMIQTVMTDAEHRKQGLIRNLFNPVQEHIADSTGRTFLTASKNMDVFYGKFGYKPFPLIDHFKFTGDFSRSHEIREFRKVDLNIPMEYEAFVTMAEKRTPVSENFGFVEKNWLLLWFCKYFHGDNIVYVPSLEAYLIYTLSDGILEFKDIVARKIPTLQQCLDSIDTREIHQIKVFFSPDLLGGFYESVEDDDDWFYTDGEFPIPANGICLPDTQRG